MCGLYVAYNHASLYALVLAETVQTTDSVNRYTHFLGNRRQCFAILYFVINTLGRVSGIRCVGFFGLSRYSDLPRRTPDRVCSFRR